MTVRLAVIGGTGLNVLPEFELQETRLVDTPYGKPSAALQIGTFNGHTISFLARHGEGHHIPPHLINYRANIWALRKAGIQQVLSVAAVGGIRNDMQPGLIAFPYQILDYTYGREHTYSDGQAGQVDHIEFGQPYTESFRQQCIRISAQEGLEAIQDGVYAATQGPRLETEAEIRRLQKDGADMVGMTGMPEAALAREAGLEYVCCAVMVNWAAGLGEGGIHDQIETSVAEGMQRVAKLLRALVSK